MSGAWLAIVGIGEDGVLGAEAAGLVAGAALVVGGVRHLRLADALIRGERMAWPSPMLDAVPAILARRGAPVAVLASGDPLWFGVGAALLRAVPAAEVRVVPVVSSLQLGAARLGWAMEGVACVSCCGRPVEGVRRFLHEGARLLVLCADGGTPGEVAGYLRDLGFGASVLHVMEGLGGPAERVRRVGTDGVPGDVGPLCLLGVEVRGGPGLMLAAGLPEGLFEHDGQISKGDVRALTLAALAPAPGQLLWDVGCGSGAVGIEWMLRHPACRTLAAERRADRAARARRNGAAMGVVGYRVVEGEAPDVLAGWPAPDAVFLGGGAHRPGVIGAAWAALRPGGRLVANAVALDTETALVAAQRTHGGTLLRVGLERLDTVGGMAAFRPALTVTQWRAVR